MTGICRSVLHGFSLYWKQHDWRNHNKWDMTIHLGYGRGLITKMIALSSHERYLLKLMAHMKQLFSSHGFWNTMRSYNTLEDSVGH